MKAATARSLRRFDEETAERLLRHAALAAGVSLRNSHFNGMGFTYSGSRPRSPWLPLDDDAEAFRLAIKLRISIKLTPLAVNISAKNGGIQNVPLEGGFSAQRRAVRMAIVQAAAQIWRSQ